MTKSESFDGRHTKIEAGQILHPDCFPQPNELVCIQVPKVFDQVSLRDCVTRHVQLTPGHRGDSEEKENEKHCGPSGFTFEGATDFDIVEVKVISKTDSLTRPGFKKLKLFVKIKYTILYSDGKHDCLKVCDEAPFTLVINEIYCPSCTAQIGVIRFPEADHKTIDKDGTLIKVEALVEAFNASITGNRLTIDIGAFFIVKCECEVQLLIPAYGYCPVPPEQINPTDINCTIFNDKTRTPFPTQFFPDQKWNPLDKSKKEEWDD